MHTVPSGAAPPAAPQNRVSSSRHVRGEAAEARVERVRVAEGAAARRQRRDVRLPTERLDDDAPDLAEVLLVEAAHRARGGPEPDARGHERRALVEGDRVAV